MACPCGPYWSPSAHSASAVRRAGLCILHFMNKSLESRVARRLIFLLTTALISIIVLSGCGSASTQEKSLKKAEVHTLGRAPVHMAGDAPVRGPGVKGEKSIVPGIIGAKIGEPVRVGAVRWKVHSVSRVQTVSQGAAKEGTVGALIVVDLTATLRRGTEGAIDQGQISLVDKDGLTYYTSGKTWVFGRQGLLHYPSPEAPMHDTVLRPLKRGEPVRGKIVFDILSSSSDLTLYIADQRGEILRDKRAVKRFSGKQAEIPLGGI